MLEEFKRPHESENFGEELDDYIIEMTKSLDEIAEGTADFQKVRKFISSLVKAQDENGFWALISSPKVDGDARVQYWYEPTYIATAIMIIYYMEHKSEAENIKDFTHTLKMALDACTGRGLNGHGYDDIRGRLYALQIFSKCKLKRFIEEYPQFCPKFTDMIKDIMNWLKAALENGETKGAWGEDYKSDMEKIVEQLVLGNEEIKVFVYGTLMKGNSNHQSFLSKAKFIGDFTAKDFELYDLGHYPGVICCKGERVKGELYAIDSYMLKKLDMLEEEGSLYTRKLTKVVSSNNQIQEAYIYVYNHDTSNHIKVSFENQPWKDGWKNDYVWYASYGSNLLYERFITYITGGICRYNDRSYEGCRNKSMPIDNKPIKIPYRMYYGNRSRSWGNEGVSFLDLEIQGSSLGRRYLITREQFKDISQQEGNGENWYNECIRLGESNGIKILTITNKSRREQNKPSDQYLEVIRKGIKETYPKMSDFDIFKYLVDCNL